MPMLVVNGATLQCTQGAAPGSLTATPLGSTSGELAAATVMDFAPMTQIAPFGLCASPANPQVAAANNAPQPCVPVVTAPWSPGAQGVTVRGFPALTDASTCQCAWAGTIQVTSAGCTVEVR